MKISMYAMSHDVFKKALTQLLHVMEKGVANARARNFDPNVLAGARLAPDMLPFVKQIQLTSDFAKNSMARLAGIDPPRFDDVETTMDELFARAGRPAHVVANAMTPASHVIDIEFREVWFLYRGIGRVRFNYLHADSRWHFIDVLADPLAFEGFMPYRGESAQVSLADADALGIAQLASGNPASIRNSVMAAFERGKPSLEYLDTAAELLLRRYEEIGNSPAVDTYGWICNLLSELGGTRYSRVLATVQKRSKDEKLAHYAGRHNGASSGPWTEPYVPGFISLTEQARKYPSPYPEITLLRETK
jgi:hypothetical protein